MITTRFLSINHTGNDDYYDEFIQEWAADRARAEAEWERWVSGWVEEVEPCESENDTE
jgi:hypothetical protein